MVIGEKYCMRWLFSKITTEILFLWLPIFFIGIIPGDFCANNGSFFLLLTWCGITKRYHGERKKIHFDLYLFWLDNYRYTYFNQEGFKFSDINILITRLGFIITIYLWTYTHNFKLIFSVIIVRLIDFHNSYFHQWFDY